jgi:hypothetical protein
MVDTSTIHALISRARRRLRVQAALEAATTASILAVAAALVVIYAVRQHALGESAGIGLLVACAGLVVAAAAWGALRRVPTHIVATRIDRASGLSDRLSSACAFEATLDSAADEHTAALMRAAIRDAALAAPRANIKAATPFRKPRDTRAALSFAVVSALVAGLYWPEDSVANPALDAELAAPLDKPQLKTDRFIEEDLDYTRDLLEDLRRIAGSEREPNLETFVNEIEELLAKAELGELSKEQLLDQLAKAEERFMQGGDDDMERTMADLSQTGRELEKNKLTRELGQALQKGDLEKAQKEMEQLAQKLEQDQLGDKQKQELAKALENAADKFQKKQEQREKRMDEQIAEKERQLRKLERKQQESKNEDEKQRLKRKIEQDKRELKKLERDKEREQESAQQRNLKQLHRNMKQASQELRKDGDKQENQRMASRSLSNAAKDTGKVEDDRRKMATQKKVASQMSDLKEAMRRARRQQGQGMRDLFGKNRRNEDFRRRSRGQQGSRGAWRPGQGQQGQGQQGQGQQGQQGQNGQQPGGQGQQPGGDSYGDGHDPYVMGDPTDRSGKIKDESVSGVHGKGPSRRETILAAAQKGFSNRAYKNVYAEYKAIVEEVIRAEKVPSGYKYYVKRYFQKIKPHSMD